MTHTEHTRKDYRRNFAAMLTDFIFFSIAFNLFNPNSVLPGLVGELTDNARLIGLGSTVFSICWTLPQMVAAHFIQEKPRKKPYLLAGMTGRVMLWIIAWFLWLNLSQRAAVTLTILFVCIGLFAISDGLSGLAWFDILARAIPMRQRGRLISVGQVVSGLAGVGVGVLMRNILARYAFPTDYALFFALAGIVLIPSTIALLLIKEPESPTATGAREADRAKRYTIKEVWADRRFRQIMASRVLVSLMGLATPFYVPHAKNVLNLPQQVIGDFVVAQTAAGIGAGLLLGLISERWGPRYVTRVGGFAAALGPIYALVTHLTGAEWLSAGYPFIYVAMGVISNAWLSGFMNYLLEIAPTDGRSAYVGLSNTVIGIMTVAPVVGGWLLEETSYMVLFALTAVIVGAGFLSTFRLQPAATIASERRSL